MDDHDKGLAHDLDTLGRRRVLLGAAGLAATTVLTAWGCGGGDRATRRTASSGSSALQRIERDRGSSGTCAVSAEETQGPFPADGSNSDQRQRVERAGVTGILRSDIRRASAA